MATGIDAVYPRRHQALARQLEQAGCLVTEFPPGTPPLRPIADFPHLAPVVRERGLFESYSLSLDHHALSTDSKGSQQWLVGSLGRINRVFPTPKQC